MQGGEVPNASRYRFLLKNDKVSIVGEDRLYVTFKDKSRVLEFWVKRGDKAEVFTADVTEKFYTKLMNDAVEQRVGKKFPTKPQIVDASKTRFSLGIPKEYFDELVNNMQNVEILKLE